MKKLFTKTNCLILAVAVFTQSFGMPLMGQTIKATQAWPTNNTSNDDSGSSTKTVVYVAIGVCLAAAITATIIVLAKKNKAKKKMSTSSLVNPYGRNMVFHDKYAEENFVMKKNWLFLPESYTNFELVKADFSSKALERKNFHPVLESTADLTY